MALPFVGVAAVGIAAYAAWPNAPQHARPYVKNTPAELAPPPQRGQSWSIKPDGGHPIRYAKEGSASKKFDSIPTIFKRIAATRGNDKALAWEKPGYAADAAGEWQFMTWGEYYDRSKKFAKALIAAGHQPYESVAVCGFNHAAWHTAHMGAILACGLSAGTYTTNSPEACAFVASDSKAVVAAVDTVANAKKYLAKLGELPKLKRIVVWLEEIPADLKAKHAGLLVSLDEFLAAGANESDEKFNARGQLSQVQNAATLIYTSGTTGNPKAVMVSHDAMLYSAGNVLSTFAHTFSRMISYLPLSHIAAQILDIFIPLVYADERRDTESLVIYFARPDALKGTLGITLKACKPEFFFGVPRVWEKFVEGIKAKARATPATGLKKKLVDFSKDVGLRASYARQSGGDGYIPRGYGVAQKLVHAKVREALGLEHCKVCATGAAPISRDTLEFLAALGIDVGEVYGMSETCGMGTMSIPEKFKFGSCGFMTPTMELKTEFVKGRDKEGEGEICFRGRHVMMGYMNNDAKTREAIDEDGWMHSGDVGRIDQALGHVYITGRIKELIIGAGGENIAPVPIEEVIKKNCPALSNVVMIGNNRKFNVCLVTLKSRPNLETGDFFDELFGEALDVNPAVKTVTAARDDAKWRAYIQAGIDQYNKTAVSNAQKIQKFVILAKDLSVATEELTATLKLKRGVVEEKFKSIIDALYE